MNNATDIFAAEILIHESIHAYMASLLSRVQFNSMTLDQIYQLDFPTAFDDYVNVLVSSNQAELRATGRDPQFDHQYMANSLLTMIASALKDYDSRVNGRTQTDEFYWSLSWTGLQQSATWQSFQSSPATNDSDTRGLSYALTPSRMANINNILTAERTGQSVNGVNVKGKQPNANNCYQ